MPWSGCQAQSEDQGMYHMWGEGGSIYIPDASIPGILPYSISEMQPPFLHPQEQEAGKTVQGIWAIPEEGICYY